MAGMKTILLEAATALQKVLDADGTIEQVLELLDHVQDFPSSERETR
jgi:hypothetical protein